MRILIIADRFDEGNMIKTVLSLITVALRINANPEIHLALNCHNNIDYSNLQKFINPISKLICISNTSSPRSLANLISQMPTDYTHIIASSNNFGREIISYLAGISEINPISNVVEVIEPFCFKRFCYAGSIVETIKAPENTTALLTVVTSGFPTYKQQKEENLSITQDIQNITIEYHEDSNLVLKEDKRKKFDNKNADLTTAEIVLGAGRGIGSAENFDIIRNMAKKMGAAVGATKVAVDRGYAPNDCQIGQTGKTISPDVYFSFCMSGSLQHIAGIKNSKLIVAVNSDENAPIFKYCDFYIVVDFFDIYEELVDKFLTDHDDL